MTCYIIGLIDHENINESCGRFLQAERELEAKGHNALHIMREFNWKEDYQEEFKKRINWFLRSESVFVLADWEQDNIAQHEFALAITMGKVIMFANNLSYLPRRIDFTIPKNLNHAV